MSTTEIEPQLASEDHAVQQARFDLVAQRHARPLADLLRRLQPLLMLCAIAISGVVMLDPVHRV